MQSLPDVPVRQVVLGTLVVSMCIVLVLVIISLVTGRGPDSSAEAADGAREQRDSPLERIIGPLQTHHFSIPNPEREVLELRIVPFRDPDRPWSQEEIELFWLDPLTIGLEEVETRNRMLIEELYATIP